jgi:hypothetical protein
MSERPPCQKVSFVNYGEALKRLFELALIEPHRRGTPPFRAYYCPHGCRSWHLSRSPERRTRRNAYSTSTTTRDLDHDIDRELIAVGMEKEEDRMAPRTARDETGPIAELFNQYMAANPQPHIDPETRIRDLVICIRRVVASEWGTCPEGQVMLANEPVVVGLPAAFIPLIQWIG